MSNGTRGERPASGSGTLWGGKPADNVSVGSSRTSQRATPATYADEKRLGAAETCNMSYIKTGETAETPEPKGTAAVLGVPSSPRDCSFDRPAESTQLRVARTSSFGTGELSYRFALRGDASMPACGREDGGGVVAKHCPVMGRTG